jgi:pyruvate dehydrogenase (quinone)
LNISSPLLFHGNVHAYKSAEHIPRRPDFGRSLSGDGGLAMLLGDLLTLRQLQVPVKLVVFKNDALSFVELELKAAGFLDFATDLHNPDFAKMAAAAGLLGLTAETPEQVRPLLGQTLDHDGPALVEVVVNR